MKKYLSIQYFWWTLHFICVSVCLCLQQHCCGPVMTLGLSLSSCMLCARACVCVCVCVCVLPPLHCIIIKSDLEMMDANGSLLFYHYQPLLHSRSPSRWPQAVIKAVICSYSLKENSYRGQRERIWWLERERISDALLKTNLKREETSPRETGRWDYTTVCHNGVIRLENGDLQF